MAAGASGVNAGAGVFRNHRLGRPARQRFGGAG